MTLCLLAAADVLRAVGSVLLALLILLAMVTVHEFGHYAAGKLLHFKVEEFSVGFGPKLFSRAKKDGEVFSVRLLPLGGYCAFAGEDAEDADPDAFPNKAPWKRIVVLAAGALMNYLLALLLILGSFAFCGRLQPMVQEVQPATDPAAAAARKSRAPCGQEPAPERTGGNKKTPASSRRGGPFMPYYKKSEKPQRK